MRRARRGAALLAAVAWLACEGGPAEPEGAEPAEAAGAASAPDPAARRVLAPRQRFAQLAARTAGRDSAPVLAIADDTRPVLWKGPDSAPSGLEHTVLDEPEAELGPRGLLARRVPLPPFLADAPRVALAVSVQFAGRWSTFPRFAITPVREGDRAFAPFERRVPIRGERVPVRVTAMALPASAPPPLETGEIAVPPGAQLRFAIGIPEPGWEQGPVAFRIEACAAGSCDAIFEETLDPSTPSGRVWGDRVVALGSHADRRVSFRFETRPLASEGEGAFTLPFWADPTLLSPESRGPGDWNLVLVSIDTLRADHVSAYGYARSTTPFLDANLVSGGTLFERCIAPAPTTAPSHMTLFTSLAPSVHGVLRNATLGGSPTAAPTLAETLRASGFETVALTENGAIGALYGFARGFDVFVENKQAEARGYVGHVEDTLRRARRWLGALRERRFFLFLHTYQVHTPYQPPPAYAQLFEADGRVSEARSGLPEDRHPDLYDREVRYVDDALREFFAHLDALGLADETVVVLTSDHGEAFLEHGLLGHRGALHEEVLRVPLVLRGPGIAAGRRVSTPVGLVDVMPTVLELVGVPVPGALMGRSLAALARESGPPRDWPDRPIFSESWDERALGPGAVAVSLDTPGVAVRLGSRKLLRRAQGDGVRWSYYDLERDPQETAEPLPAPPAAAEDLVALLDDFTAGAAARRRELLKRSRPDGERAPREIDPERLEKLRSLGYVD